MLSNETGIDLLVRWHWTEWKIRMCQVFTTPCLYPPRAMDGGWIDKTRTWNEPWAEMQSRENERAQIMLGFLWLWKPMFENNMTTKRWEIKGGSLNKQEAKKKEKKGISIVNQTKSSRWYFFWVSIRGPGCWGWTYFWATGVVVVR